MAWQAVEVPTVMSSRKVPEALIECLSLAPGEHARRRHVHRKFVFDTQAGRVRPEVASIGLDPDDGERSTDDDGSAVCRDVRG